MSDTSKHVERFLGTIDNDEVTWRVGLTLLQPKGRRELDPELLIETWFIQQARQRYRDLSVLRPIEALVRDTIDLSATLYLSIQTQAAESVEPVVTSAQLKKLLNSVEPDFIEQLLNQVRWRESRRPEFSRKIGAARAFVVDFAKAVRRAVENDPALVEPLMGIIPERDPDVMRRDQGGDGGDVFVLVLLVFVFIAVVKEVRKSK